VGGYPASTSSPLTGQVLSCAEVLDLEVFNDPAVGVDDHDDMVLTGPIQAAKSPMG
jgi:hypothetical protein